MNSAKAISLQSWTWDARKKGMKKQYFTVYLDQDIAMEFVFWIWKDT